MSTLLATVGVEAVSVVANLKWDPTVRGILFPGIQFLVLVGSSYLILATNVGNRLGFLLANAAFWGWMVLMSVVWMVYGIGPKGAAPSWKVTQTVQDTASAELAAVRALPNTGAATPATQWRAIAEGVAMRGEAVSAAESHLNATKELANYTVIAAYDTGGDQRLKVWPKLNAGAHWYDPTEYHFRGLLHTKHLFAVQVQPALQTASIVNDVQQYDSTGQPVMVNVVKGGTTQPDTAKAVTTIVLVRDLGRLRQPPLIVFLCSSVLLAISLVSLHRRDKLVMATMAQGSAVA